MIHCMSARRSILLVFCLSLAALLPACSKTSPDSAESLDQPPIEQASSTDALVPDAPRAEQTARVGNDSEETVADEAIAEDVMSEAVAEEAVANVPTENRSDDPVTARAGGPDALEPPRTLAEAETPTDERPRESHKEPVAAPDLVQSRIDASQVAPAPEVVPELRKIQPIAIPDQKGATPPKVVTTEDHRKTSLVHVGDVMPDLALSDLQGNPTSLSSEMGEGLTVVLFWTTELDMALEQFHRLGVELAFPFQAHGVRVIAVNVGAPLELVKSKLPQADPGFVPLVDSDGTAFAKVATRILPRTYVLTSDRRVLWFDLEYSRPMRRELNRALFYYLVHGPN